MAKRARSLLHASKRAISEPLGENVKPDSRRVLIRETSHVVRVGAALVWRPINPARVPALAVRLLMQRFEQRVVTQSSAAVVERELAEELGGSDWKWIYYRALTQGALGDAAGESSAVSATS